MTRRRRAVAVRVVFVCLLVVSSAVACGPGRGLRVERPRGTSDRRPPVDTLVEIDPHTGSVVYVVRLADPGPVAVSGSSVWVASPPRRTVSRVDARSGRILATTHLAVTPVALSPGQAGSVWVLASGRAPAVIQLNAETGQITKHIPLAACCPGPSAIATAPSGTLWVAGREGVLRINPRTGAKTIVAPQLKAAAITTTPSGHAFVSNGWDRVTPAPPGRGPSFTFKGRARGTSPAYPTGLVYGHGKLWAVAGTRQSVLAMALVLNFGSEPIRVGRAPADIAYGEGSVWVANRGDGTISQINPTSMEVTRTIHIGYRPAGLAVGAGAVWATTRRVRATAAATGLLAFDDHGQIFTSRPDGSQRTQLTHQHWPLQDIAPVWSPDGRRIAYMRIRRSTGYDFTILSLYAMNADGSRQRPIPDTRGAGDPAWSSDGTNIAFDADPGLWTIRVDGTHRMLLTRAPGAGSADPAWSPDGTRVGFDSNRHGPAFNIYTIQSDGTRVRRMARVPSQYMVWSPDGRRIVFNRYKIIVSESVAGDVGGKFLGEFIAPASGGRGVRLLPPTNRYAPGGPFGPSVVSWSPDGSAIAVSGLPPDASPAEIYIANADGTGLTFVARGNHASWSPVP